MGSLEAVPRAWPWPVLGLLSANLCPNKEEDRGLDSQEDSPHYRVIQVIVNIDAPHKPVTEKLASLLSLHQS